MRAVFLAFAILATCFVSMAWSKPTAFRAGVTRVTISANNSSDTWIWYPTEAEEVAWHSGPFPIEASRDAPVAAGPFPVVLISHGGGKTGGTPLLLRDLSISLARHGFIVIAPVHGKADIFGRMIQVKAAFDTVLADSRFRQHAVSDKVGMVGFSLGGAVSLGLAGGTPNLKHLVNYCATHVDDVQSCNAGPRGDESQTSHQDIQRSVSGLPLKAIVLLDPLSVLYDQDGLRNVKAPVFLFRPKHSKLGEENTRGLVKHLPVSPPLQYVPGGHFVFADICPPALKAEAPDVCEDAKGVDRAAIHREVETKVAAFFRDNLS
ncbi:alpha/beta hydrolase family protein [Phyllobacterium myrsinacearum]|uniref:Putative dienelactone hydrolase n=1 Tax=Phyllobacterium myrsinacearum TaxID=28101 RepID=A0A839ELI9_9HYPH|nr:dienelactone hydrolase [Phyllobacterium myrsinacearum]MBA8879689.1 putative dienelactone hydrolase [Phyllobacterium myrsinacearum]